MPNSNDNLVFFKKNTYVILVLSNSNLKVKIKNCQRIKPKKKLRELNEKIKTNCNDQG